MLRLCLDLNIWVAALLADRKGRSNTASQYLIEVIRSGNDTFGEVNLIISLGMLEREARHQGGRLQSVIVEQLKLSLETAATYVATIEEYATLGAQLTLGGTGVIGLRDIEDAHVLETAIAGQADFLVTANFKDFVVNRDIKIEIPERHAIYYSSAYNVQIVHPYLMVEWLRSGNVPKISNTNRDRFDR